MTPVDLRQWREHHALTQHQLASLLSVDHMTVSRWERGTRSVPAYLALAIRGLECIGTTHRGKP